jgi:hypothetical protein
LVTQPSWEGLQRRAFSSAEMPIHISQNGGVLWRWPPRRPISGRQNR